MFQKPEGILVVTALLFGFIFLFIITSPLRNLGRGVRESVSPPATGEDRGAHPPPFQAFRPPQPRVEPLPKTSLPPPPATATPPATPGLLSNLKRVNDIVFPTNLVPPKPSELLELPAVPESELAIDPKGVDTAVEYMQYFAEHITDIPYSYEKMKTAVRDESGALLLPQQLIEKALSEGNFEPIRESLLVFKEFISIKMNFLKSIKVTGEAIAAGQKIVGFDKLTLILIDKVLEVQAGTRSRADFEDYFKKYKATAAFWNQKLNKEAGAVPLSGNQNFFHELLNVFGLGGIAHALGLPFGGYIGATIPCECIVEIQPAVPFPGSVLFVAVTPPPYSGNFYISDAQQTTLGTLLTAGVSPGAWILGFQSPALPTPPFTFTCGFIAPGTPPPCTFIADSEGIIVYAGSGRR